MYFLVLVGFFGAAVPEPLPNRAMENKYAIENPMKGVRIPLNKPKEERRALTNKQQFHIIEVRK